MVNVNHSGNHQRQTYPLRVKHAKRHVARKKRNKRLPPGQRLVLYGMLACLITLLQCYKLPADTPNTTLANDLIPETPVLIAPPFALKAESETIATGLKEAANLPKLTAGVFAVDLDSGEYAEINGYHKFPAASIIKIPILVALLSAQDKHLVDPNKQLELRKDLMAGGSGILQWRPVGSKISVQDAAELMITRSDNTATNLVIDLLGGIDKFNPLFKQWGLKQTQLNAWLPDLPGANKTSPYELAYLVARINNGEILEKKSHDWMFNVMQRVRNKSLIPNGLGKEARIAHKTGDIGSMVGDAGIVWCNSGKCYLVAIQVERPHNDRRANVLVRKLSKIVYEGFTGELVPDPPKPKFRARHYRLPHGMRHVAKHKHWPQYSISKAGPGKATTRSVRSKAG
ncbi:MAG: class A beta-lactamase-related serine hydrolase [Candidatus Obscuribacterales bacterium]|nr:class A beta-lactamase-related serine hydrolase [Candidatus Obscuribacterales bacterium]